MKCAFCLAETNDEESITISRGGDVPSGRLRLSIPSRVLCFRCLRTLMNEMTIQDLLAMPEEEYNKFVELSQHKPVPRDIREVIYSKIKEADRK